MPWLAFGYPVLTHLAVLLHDARLQWLALVCLWALTLWSALSQRRAWAWVVFLIGCGALYGLTIVGKGMYILYIPPIAIPLALLILFARSLRNEAIPVVSRVAEIMRGEPLPDVLRAYTRNVTRLWCVVFVAMMLSAVATALWAATETWSLATNVIHYIVLGSVFVLEYLYRRVKYRDLEQWGLLQYLRRLARTNIRI
ncbi:MAG: hypothetical protein H7Y02_03245 [Candidatus Obscuribacterales bacterium]|nr:hypothetical protein [Steroidobacteraceae bacterium]